MAKTTGITQRHSRKCRSRSGGSCNCEPSYEAWVYSPKDKRKIRETFTGDGAFDAAKGWRIDAVKDMKDGKRRAPGPETVRAAGEALIEGMRDGSVRDRSGKRYKPSTIRSYKASLEKHVYDDLGARKLASVTYLDLQDLVDRLAADGLDGSTIRNIAMPLRVLYRRARRQIPVNPTIGLEIIARANKAKRIVSADVAAKMIDAVPLGEKALRGVAFFGGLRAGELAGLRVEDVELFEEGRWGLLHVRQAWDKFEGAQAPKSAAGLRVVPVCEQLYELLDEHLLRLGWSEGLIFGRSPTQPFSYSGVRVRATRAYEKAKLEPSDLQLHECRHSYSSWLSAAGVADSRADRYMGHADHSTPGRYRHQLDAQYLEDARALGGYLRLADTESRLTGARTGAQEPQTA